MKMSSLHRVEGLSVLGDGPAPGVARRGPWESALRGIGRPGLGGSALILSRLRGCAVGGGGVLSGMGTLGRAVPRGARGAAGREDEVEGRRLHGEDRALRAAAGSSGARGGRCCRERPGASSGS